MPEKLTRVGSRVYMHGADIFLVHQGEMWCLNREDAVDILAGLQLAVLKIDQRAADLLAPDPY